MADTNKRYLSADDYLHDIWRLAARIRASSWKPDRLVALWRGGAFPGVVIHEYLRATGWDVAHVPLKCSSYLALGVGSGTLSVSAEGEAVIASFRRGEKILVVDDVFDTGLTAAKMSEIGRTAGVEMKLACVYWKSACNRTTLAPDWYEKDFKDEWIVFPHELEGLTRAEIADKDPLLSELLA